MSSFVTVYWILKHRGTDKYTAEKNPKDLTQGKIFSGKAVVAIGDSLWVFMPTGIN